MKVISEVVLLILMCSAIVLADSNEPTGKILVYRGMSDASAAVAVSDDMFVVADDENNILRVYKSSEGGLPEFCFDMTDFLG
ncbi:MAG: DUF3616 domain-containing protein, partial [Planctomycetota bacterium]|nr:DUF3616 domain-containing protein [Planctomycetota bacterium]